MFHILNRTVSPTTPKLQFLRSHTQLCVKFICTTSSRSRGSNSFTVSYLIDTCGFSPERAESVSKHVTSEKPGLAFEFFRSHRFSQSQALSVIRGFPQLLLADPENSLKPKIDFFKSKGFSDPEIRNIIVGHPSILGRSLQNEIIPCFDFFNDMFPSKHKLMNSVMHYPEILCDLEDILVPNMKLLRQEGVPQSHIVRFIELFPGALKAPPKRFEEKVQEVKELGFSPLRLQFVYAVHVKISIGRSAWARKEGIYRKWGWTDDDIFWAFRVYPWCFSTSDDNIEAVMDFLVKKLGYTPSAIARCPVVLKMSLEKQIMPRGSVILVLMSKGLVDKLSLSAIFMCKEIAFLDRFVHRHEKQADELLKLYHAKIALTG